MNVSFKSLETTQLLLMNSVLDFSSAGERRQSSFFPSTGNGAQAHFDVFLSPNSHNVFENADNYFENEKYHAGLQLPRNFSFDSVFGASIAPHSGAPGLFDHHGETGRAAPSILSPDVKMSSNLLDTPFHDSFTAPTSTTVTPRSSVAPKELPDALNLRNRDFIREHFSRDQVNREYTFRDPSPLGGRSSFSLAGSLGLMDVNKLNQLMHSLYLGDLFKDSADPVVPKRSSIWGSAGSRILPQNQQTQIYLQQASTYPNTQLQNQQHHQFQKQQQQTQPYLNQQYHTPSFLNEGYQNQGHQILLNQRTQSFQSHQGQQIPNNLQNYGHRQSFGNFNGNFNSNFNSNVNVSPPMSLESRHAVPPTSRQRHPSYKLPPTMPEYLVPAVSAVDRSKRNFYSEKLHTPTFVPTDHKPQSLTNAEHPVEQAEKRPASRKPLESSVKNTNKRKKPTLSADIVVNFGNLEKQPLSATPEVSLSRNNCLGKECSRYILESCSLKDYPEDFCSTFYKRNKHGYMFIRELSNSLKVNNSGPKSWVTIKVKLGASEQQKLKVDVKRLPVWKPINLNQPNTLRKAIKRRKPLKKPMNRRR